MHGIHGVLAGGVVPIDFCLQPFVRLRVAQEAIEYVTQSRCGGV